MSPPTLRRLSAGATPMMSPAPGGDVGPSGACLSELLPRVSARGSLTRTLSMPPSITSTGRSDAEREAIGNQLSAQGTTVPVGRERSAPVPLSCDPPRTGREDDLPTGAAKTAWYLDVRLHRPALRHGQSGDDSGPGHPMAPASARRWAWRPGRGRAIWPAVPATSSPSFTKRGSIRGCGSVLGIAEGRGSGRPLSRPTCSAAGGHLCGDGSPAATRCAFHRTGPVFESWDGYYGPATGSACWRWLTRTGPLRLATGFGSATFRPDHRRALSDAAAYGTFPVHCLPARHRRIALDAAGCGILVGQPQAPIRWADQLITATRQGLP